MIERTDDVERGLYEVLITEALEQRLASLPGSVLVRRDPLRAVEAGDRIALHLGRVVERAVSGLPDDKRVEAGLRLARLLVARIAEELHDNDVGAEAPFAEGQVLREIAGLLPDGHAEQIARPLIPLLDTTLLTNSPGEPRVGSQLAAEIESAQRIDVVMAFVRSSGIRPLIDALERHTSLGGSLRVLTTTYTGSTEQAALELLTRAGAEVRVSYDTSTTRLHAKAWLFHRASGFSTAYIGSSNLTHSAQVTGLEWNVRVSAARNPDVVAKVAAVFDSYWESGDFVRYDRMEFAEVSRLEHHEASLVLSPLEVRLEPFQERLLEQIALSRERGRHRNLLVSATGTGKTVMAAVDYARLRDQLPRNSLLFVAHRSEILEQSLATFRHVLREPSFGELWVGGQHPRRFVHIFASVQSLAASGFASMDPHHFDVIVIDEFHHAAAPTYRAILEQLAPAELLGLTATPERSDGLPVLRWFDGRIAAELRLWDAIDQHRLSPFQYFGVHDGLDLRAIPWKRGSGYDAEGLTNCYTANDVWGRQVIAVLRRFVTGVETMRALGFCVSIEHARFMARLFTAAGLESVAVSSETPPEVRRTALNRLARGELRVVFSVDIFNEGVDVPEVDTLLLLRPTDSPTLFLQQLGRGLRRAAGKDVCTVLDFVGIHRKEFRFDRRYRALLGGSRADLERQVQQGFPFLPAGCHLELDPVAAGIVLESIRAAVPSNWPAKVEELRLLSVDGHELTLRGYLEGSGLELDDVYAGGKSWSDLRIDAGIPVLSSGPDETLLRRAIGRLLHVDDEWRLGFWHQMLMQADVPSAASMVGRERRLARMLATSLGRSVLDKDQTLDEALVVLWKHSQVRSELIELMDLLIERIDHLQPRLDQMPDVPLRVHARYTRDEILAAFGVGETNGAKVAPWQTGVRWVEEAHADLLAFTLDKTTGGFSPTTRYRDYAISRELIHWESQGVTRSDSPTGRRYQHHVEQGSAVMLFARLRQNDRAFWFLGPAYYVSHEGERPMAVTWRLEHALPGDLFAEFAAAVA